MSDTGEQGVTPQDPAQQAGVGGGLVPDDRAEGYEQAVEPAQEQDSNKKDTSTGD